MVELKNVSGGYAGTGKSNISKSILKDISLKCKDGQITVIVGPNGCGKTTILNMCAGMLNPSSGQVLVDGHDMATLPRIKAAQKISVLPQGRTVPDITVEAFVLHGRFPWLGYPRVYRDEDRAIADTAMEQAGIIKKRRTLLAKLSGGERQKAYLAMLLAQNTGNILLDEPTTYLDIAHQLELADLIKGLKSVGKCIIAVLHDLTMALEIADNVAVIKDGRLLGIGAPDDALKSGQLENALGVRVVSLPQIIRV